MGLFNRRKPEKQLRSFSDINNESVADDFSIPEKKTCTDPYLQHAWVSVCIDILTRNVARAEFEILKNGKVQKIHSLQSSSDIRIRTLAALTYGNRPAPGGVWTVKHSGGLERITAAAFLQKSIF
ncbi:MAG: hypothetical protein SPK18_00545 [Treponema sp.]|nr:hypothetical protein [Treponema sp.]MDY5757057.1 hypothetical protein [Treponema sp.]